MFDAVEVPAAAGGNTTSHQNVFPRPQTENKVNRNDQNLNTSGLVRCTVFQHKDMGGTIEHRLEDREHGRVYFAKVHDTAEQHELVDHKYPGNE